MDDSTKLLLDWANKNGWIGIVSIIIFWDKFSPFYKKYISGNYVSWKFMSEKLAMIEKSLNGHLEEYKEFMKRENDENIRMAKTETKIENIEEVIRDIKQNQHDTFQLLSEMKSIMIQQGTK